MRFEEGFKFLIDTSDLIGRDEEKAEVVYRIASGNMLLIEGKRGIGKTALLEYAIDNFRGIGKVVYIDIGTFGKRLDISSLLKGRGNGMILLIDNIEYLSESNNKKIKFFYDQDRIKSVVFTTRDAKEINFTNAIRSRIGRNVIKLKDLSKGEISQIAKDRLSEDFVISDKVLDELYSVSKNLKEFLINCDLLCAYLDKENRVEAEVKDVKKIARSLEVDEGAIHTCLECNGPLIEISKHWRCKRCDEYCDSCGVLTSDSECPACGKSLAIDEDSNDLEVEDE